MRIARRLFAALTLLALATTAAAQGTVMPVPRTQWLDSNGNVVSLGTITIYEAGTTTESDTYSCVGLTVGCINPNPITLNAAGRPAVSGTEVAIYLTPGQSYKFVLKNSTGTTLWTQDNISAVPAGNVNVDVEATAGEDITAGQVVYLSNGSGSKVAGQWYRGDADFTYANSTPMVGIAPSAIASGDTGSVRIQGRVEGLSGLVPGTLYYISATAGDLTSTAPTDARLMGQADGTTTFVVAPNPPFTSSAIATVTDPKIKTLVNGRLTLTSATPVTSGDVTAATTLYWALYQGNEIGLYTGSAWTACALAQLSVAVPNTSDQMYDVFIDYNDACASAQLVVLAWTNDTTRATALTTQDGIYVKTGDTQQRYVGSFRTTGVAGQTEDSLAKRFVWNYYNRVRRPVRVFEATNTWTQNPADAWAQANGSTANQIAVVTGVQESTITLAVTQVGSQAGATTFYASIGVGGVTPASVATIAAMGAFSLRSTAIAQLLTMPAVGYSYYTWITRVTDTALTLYGDDGGSTLSQSGISGWWES